MQSARFWALVFAAAALPSVASAQASRVTALRTAAQSTPSAEAQLGLGRALARAGQFDEALTELRKGAAMPDGHQPAQAIKLHFAIARALIGKRDFGQAMVSCKVVGAQTGGAAAGHACAAEAHLLWKRASEALSETALALAGGNHSYEAKVAEGRAEALSLADAKAEASYREAIAWNPASPEAYVFLGQLLIDTGRAQDAATELRKALAIDSADPDASYELGRALPPGADAVTAFERAAQERPTFTVAWSKLASTELSLGHLQNAHKAADAAVRGASQDAGAHVLLGKVMLAEGKADEALAEANAALGILANSAQAKLLVADAYAAKGEVDLALEQYQNAYGLDHSDASPLLHAAAACIKAGRATSAKAYGDKATKDFPVLAAAWVTFGDALVADKEPAQAKAAYEKALTLAGVDQAAVRAKLGAVR